MKVLIFSGLFLGFLLLFQQMELLRKMEKFWQKTRGDMEASARLRVLVENGQKPEVQRAVWKISQAYGRMVDCGKSACGGDGDAGSIFLLGCMAGTGGGACGGIACRGCFESTPV